MGMEMSDRMVEDLIRHFDTSGNGRISRHEFEKEFEYGSGHGHGHSYSHGGRWRMSDDAIRLMKDKFRDHGVDVREAFEAFDDNGDGFLSTAEFRRGVDKMSLRLTSREVDDLIRHFDSSGNGRISRRDFEREFYIHSGGDGDGHSHSHGGRWRMSDDAIRLMKDKFRSYGASLRDAFNAFDDSGDGLISTAEFRRGLDSLRMGLTLREVEDLIRHFDTDGDGRISFREFRRELEHHGGGGTMHGYRRHMQAHEGSRTDVAALRRVNELLQEEVRALEKQLV
eukprot:SAG11_NODE_5560_length_1525_cov_2.044881_2_plen_281_part_01